MYRSHAQRIWDAEKWREREEEAIKREKLARKQGITGALWNAVSKQDPKEVELDEDDVSTEALIRRAARQKPPAEKPVLSDSHRRRGEREQEEIDESRRMKAERERREKEEGQRKNRK